MKEWQHVVILLQRQRILLRSVEKATGKSRGRETDAVVSPCCAPSTQRYEFSAWIATSQCCKSRPGPGRTNPPGLTSNWSCLILNGKEKCLYWKEDQMTPPSFCLMRQCHGIFLGFQNLLVYTLCISVEKREQWRKKIFLRLSFPCAVVSLFPSLTSQNTE